MARHIHYDREQTDLSHLFTGTEEQLQELLAVVVPDGKTVSPGEASGRQQS